MSMTGLPFIEMSRPSTRTPKKRFPSRRPMVTVPFTYCAACLTMKPRSQSLNQAVCVMISDSAAMPTISVKRNATICTNRRSPDIGISSDPSVPRRTLPFAIYNTRPAILATWILDKDIGSECLSDAEVHPPIPLLRFSVHQQPVDVIELVSEIDPHRPHRRTISEPRTNGVL